MNLVTGLFVSTVQYFIFFYHKAVDRLWVLRTGLGDTAASHLNAVVQWSVSLKM